MTILTIFIAKKQEGLETIFGNGDGFRIPFDSCTTIMTIHPVIQNSQDARDMDDNNKNNKEKRTDDSSKQYSILQFQTKPVQ